jgi:glycosyltransferase involved in cell wall biosynthesis
VLAVTESDRAALLAAAREAHPEDSPGAGQISVLPIAVDTEALQPVERRIGSIEILTLGTLHYAPNAEGIRWFVREVFPLIRHDVPGATLTIVGKNPPRDLSRLALEQQGAVSLEGYVEDLLPYMQRAGVLVVPVRSGSGMRVRVLEALARGMPVVTTSVGAEGIAARSGEDLILADSSQGFAEAVTQVLRRPGLGALLSTNGRRLAVGLYDWRHVLRRLDAAYEASLRRRDLRIAEGRSNGNAS